MDEEMMIGFGEENFAEDIGNGVVADPVFGEIPLGVAEDDIVTGAVDDVTSDDLMGVNASESEHLAGNEHEVEDSSEMNNEDEDSPWGGACDDKCCRCNVNSSKGYW